LKNKKHHILSFAFIILSAVLIIATSPSPNFVYINNRITFEFDDGYLFIKIKTTDNPNYYVMENRVQLNFVGRTEYQVLHNFSDDYGEIIGRNVFVNFPRESEFFDYEEPVFETFVDNTYFIIKIKRELIRFENIDWAYIRMFNQNIDSSLRTHTEVYR